MLLRQYRLRDRRSRLFDLDLHPCPLCTHIPPGSLNLLHILCTVDGEIIKSPIKLTYFSNSLSSLLANSQSSLHCSWKTKPFLNAAFVPDHDYSHLLTSPVSNHIIIINLFTTLLALNCPHLCRRLEWTYGKNGCIFTNEIKLTRQNMNCLVFVLSTMKYKPKYIKNSFLAVFYHLHTFPQLFLIWGCSINGQIFGAAAGRLGGFHFRFSCSQKFTCSHHGHGYGAFLFL